MKHISTFKNHNHIHPQNDCNHNSMKHEIVGQISSPRTSVFREVGKGIHKDDKNEPFHYEENIRITSNRSKAKRIKQQELLCKIDQLILSILDQLDGCKDPIFSISGEIDKSFVTNISQARSYTSILLVLSFVQKNLLLEYKRTTTNREVYYFFVTHFRNQRECDSAIIDVANMLNVERATLGILASPKGWFCGCIEITKITHNYDGQNQQSSFSTVTDGTCLSSIQGLPITGEWLDSSLFFGQEKGEEKVHLNIKNTARAILVIEKEGVYTRLAEDRFFDIFPCIMVTGKGFPDLASRAMVHILHKRFPNLPIFGICDCNPYGVAVLQTYSCGSHKRKIDGGYRYSVPIQWIGLKPSQLSHLTPETITTNHSSNSFYNKKTEDVMTDPHSNSRLPLEVFQAMTNLDRRKIYKLMEDYNNCDSATALFLNENDEEELQEMLNLGYKVELEALHWLGMDYMCDWLEKTLLSIPL